LTYRIPVEWTLRGVLGEGSGFERDAVYVWFLYMPLFVPSTYLTLSHGGRRPNGSSTFAITDPAFADTVRDALRHVPSEREALEAIAGTDTEEARYALLVLGDARAAERLLARPLAEGDNRPFVNEARERMATVLQRLRHDGANAALTQLAAWRDYTRAAVITR